MKKEAGAGIDCRITVRVTPNSSKNCIESVLPDGSVKISLKAKPIQGEANQELIRFLAKVFRIKQSDLVILSGRQNKNKIVSITGMGILEAKRRIDEFELKNGKN